MTLFDGTAAVAPSLAGISVVYAKHDLRQWGYTVDAHMGSSWSNAQTFTQTDVGGWFIENLCTPIMRHSERTITPSLFVTPEPQDNPTQYTITTVFRLKPLPKPSIGVNSIYSTNGDCKFYPVNGDHNHI